MFVVELIQVIFKEILERVQRIFLFQKNDLKEMSKRKSIDNLSDLNKMIELELESLLGIILGFSMMTMQSMKDIIVIMML